MAEEDDTAPLLLTTPRTREVDDVDVDDVNVPLTKRSASVGRGVDGQEVGGNGAAGGGHGPPTGLRLSIRLRQCAAELVATSIFVFMGTMSVGTGNNLLVALVHGLTITLLIAAFEEISGAHINPVVTLAVTIATNSIHWLQSIFFVISQLTGGILGAALTRGVLSYSQNVQSSNTTIYESIHGGSHLLAPGISVAQGILLEVLLTFVLIQTILLVDSNKTSSHQHLLPFAVGFTVFADIAVSANITGGSMNPARSFGPAVVISDLYVEVWTYHYVYWVGPIIGSLAALLVFRLIFGGASRGLDKQTEPDNQLLSAI